MEFYKQAATDFSRTRYKIWPAVHQFLTTITTNSIILDAGCGNGKNMMETEHNFIGIDTCKELLNIVKERTINKTNIIELIEASILQLPFSDSNFDAIISIAVIHHLMTADERLRAINELIRVCKSDGTVLITVWKRENNVYYLKGTPCGIEGDRLVKWKLDDHYLDRFYHFYTYDELLLTANHIKQTYHVEITIADINWNYYMYIKKL